MNDELKLSKSVRPGDVTLAGQRRADMTRQPVAESPSGLGWMPMLSVFGAVGLMWVAVANALSRVGVPQAEALLWVGTLMLIVPVAARLTSSRPSRLERAALVVLVVVALYLVKVLN